MVGIPTEGGRWVGPWRVPPDGPIDWGMGTC